jgi:D-alanyl-D-alanine carboxypeptidase (penicillin-binding protein 5/6)
LIGAVLALAATAAAMAAAPPAPPPEAPLQDRFPKAAASYLVAIDGRVVWAGKPDDPRPPASLTKIMTALVLLEGDWEPDAPVTVSRAAAAETGSRAGLRAGETLSAGDLLTAMLITSANDACVALAEHAAGSVAAFVAAMNMRATTLGLAATRFENPCGHDAPGQRSSARDLLALAEAALTHPEFARAVALRSAEVKTTRGRRVAFKSGNHLLGNSPGVIGVKTGWTPEAGKCLVVLAERDGVRVMIVLLDAADRWWTAAAFVEEAFDAARALR